MHAKGLIILLLAITVITGVVFVWYNNQIGQSVPALQATNHNTSTDSTSLGGSIYAKSTNPASNTPDSNPLKDSVTNPFDTYKNPFDTK